MRLADGLPWSIPVTLATDVDAAEGDGLALSDGGGRLLGVLTSRRSSSATSSARRATSTGPPTRRTRASRP